MNFKITPTMILISIIVIIWIVFHGKSTVTFDAATFWCCLAFAIYWFGRTTYIEFKHYTPKIICNSKFSTTDSKITVLGNYGCVHLGVVNAKQFGIILPGNEGTLIAPMSSFNVIGDSIACTANCIEVDKDVIPPEVREALESYDFKPPFIFGFEPISKLNEPDIISMRAELEERNKGFNILRDIMKDRTKAIEDTVSSYSRIADRVDITKKMEYEKALKQPPQV